MKKAISLSVLGAVVLGLVLGATPASAAGCTIKNNKSDDGVIICNVSQSSSTKINVNQTSNVTINTNIVANTGGNSITAGGDITNASITSGSANINYNSYVDVNSVVIDYKAPPQNNNGPTVDISGNEGDDNVIIADVKEKNETEFNVNSKATVNVTENFSANAGGNTISAAEDVTNATIKSGNARVRAFRTMWVNFTNLKIH
ncbi:MAG: hypothetical protein A3H06_01500 [Candidatus Colwellbacteria bacterium RIFCSPLOWO2_12_FULL_44_13]|uniref:Uncharacterized protein n=2 Tax=Candidatus Colwelliibacteriota TaxID=1817904 RepID=A0A1G1Z3R8_9BACT|nr:MAG: hypothetical protein A3F24_02180 [Candidatus Colwellbacteria bacterium RIFCSPHIGHO2_12_FULL_44_17]OGY61349.1 MAG: hypothetical protein A3H06_01500 [Candidatus Colwellbacteria bacterium RIFCSPLOWO2_12_FULL_44_13]